MRIGFFTLFFPQRSETFVIDQIGALLDAGHDVQIFCLSGVTTGRDDPVVVEHELMDRTVTLMSADRDRKDKVLRLVGRVIRYFPQSALWLRQLRRRDLGRGMKIPAAAAAMGILAETASPPLTFDVIQVHFGPMVVVADALREMGLLRGPVVATFHGSDVSVVARTDPHRYNGVFRRVERLTANSAFLVDRILGLGAPADRTVQLPVGVDLSRFSPHYPLPDGPPRLLTVARLSPEKGVAVALHALAALRARGLDFKYTIIGDGPLRNELEGLTRSLGIHEHVEFRGAQPPDAVLEVLASHHLFLLPAIEAPSGAVEAQGRALVEAQASGLPVLATTVGGIPETVGPGAGRLVPPGDAGALAEALARLVEERSWWESMGRAGRGHVEEHFDLQRIVRRLEAIYEELTLGNRSA